VGVIIVKDGTGEEVASLSGGEANTTNNRMEITAAIEGLKLIPELTNVRLVSDSSQYIIKTLSEDWSRNKNHDLWAVLDDLTCRHIMSYQWVKGHSRNNFNNRCDKLAVEAAKRIKGW